jgi:hypothetical protein
VREDKRKKMKMKKIEEREWGKNVRFSDGMDFSNAVLRR